MDRRAFLHALGAVTAGGLLSACAAPRGDTAAPRTPDPTDEFDPVGRVAPDAQESLTVLTASYQQLVGEATPLVFGLLDQDNSEVAGADVELYVVPVDGEASGPYPAAYHQVEGAPTGLYLADVALAAAGPTSFVAVTADGRAGADTVQVATSETSEFPAPGDEAVAVPTPTPESRLGFEEICTAEPDCGMHDVSLAEALEASRPVVLMFATPAYCQTAACGPSVDVLASVREAQDWGDVAFIHCEIFSDAGETVADPVAAWGLPTEPWLYTIAADGLIRSRADGPLLSIPDQVTQLVQTVTT